MSYIYDALNTPSVTNLLDKEYKLVSGKKILSPLLFESRKIDPVYAEKSDMINCYYVSGNFPGSTFELYSIQCRSNSEQKSILIANAVKSAINRIFSDGAYFRTDILQSVQEDQNSWNTPVEVKIFSGTNV